MNEPQPTGDGATGQDAATRFRFTVRGLLVCVFGIAFGLAESRRGDGSFSGALLAALSAWAAIGFGQQARDLWRYFHGRDDLMREQRLGRSFLDRLADRRHFAVDRILRCARMPGCWAAVVARTN